MNRRLEPPGLTPPFATYAHGVEVPASSRFVFGAGQVGVRPDGSVGEGVEEQAEILWDNIRQVLAESDMEIADIVQLNMIMVDPSDRDGAMRVRDAVLGDHRPASTLMYIAQLAAPEWLIEIDYIAAKSG
jgi:2-iminobutanoate/2-iminopropanoate deaminase